MKNKIKKQIEKNNKKLERPFLLVYLEMVIQLNVAYQKKYKKRVLKFF